MAIEVYPEGQGWRWRSEERESDPFASRDEAFRDALLERDGEAIVLLRRNGSVVGELYHAATRPDTVTRAQYLASSERREVRRPAEVPAAVPVQRRKPSFLDRVRGRG